MSENITFLATAKHVIKCKGDSEEPERDGGGRVVAVVGGRNFFFFLLFVFPKKRKKKKKRFDMFQRETHMVAVTLYPTQAELTVRS